MTYVNANVYTTEPTAWAHDDCLPESEFELLPINGVPTVRMQRAPWHWWPRYGAAKPCAYCPGMVA